MKKFKIKCDNKIFEANEGENLLEVLRHNNITIPSDCGGKRRCLKCKVRISNAASYDDEKYLPDDEYSSGIRLACFIEIDRDLEVFTLKKGSADVLEADKDIFKGTKKYDKNLKKDIFAAVDIGTTTCSISVFDEDFYLLDTINFLNPQRTFGADVVARIKACDEGHLDEMTNSIRELIWKAIEKYSPKKVVISANNVMLHLFAGISPHSIGIAPYTPEFKDIKKFSFTDLNWNGNGEVILFPSISGYVGGDIVSGVIATGLQNTKKNILFMDLGTNGEMILASKGKLFSTSTAAGPAFEGGNISCGSYARAGAIAYVNYVDGKYIVDDDNADAICGSGLIDLVANLVKNEVIAETGAFEDLPEIVTKDEEKRFYLTKNVYLSQKDVRNVQLAKGAISCGIISLLKYANIKTSDLDQILIAGGFSKSLDFNSCETIGLLLEDTAKLCKAVGNTSIIGAVMAIKDESILNKASEIANNTSVLELAQDPNFFQNYAERLIFE